MPKPYAPFGPSADGTCATQHLAPEPARLSAPAFSSPVSGSPAHVCVTVLRVCARVHTCPKAIARGAHGARRAIWHTLQTHAPAHTHPHTHTHDALGAQPRLRGRACRRGCRRDLDERIAGLDVVGLRKALLHERRRAPHLAAREQGGPRFRQGQEPHFQAEGAPGMPRSRARTRTHQPRPDPPAAWPAPRTCGCCARGSTASPPHRLPPAHRSRLPVSRPIRDAALRCAAPHRCQARDMRGGSGCPPLPSTGRRTPSLPPPCFRRRAATHAPDVPRAACPTCDDRVLGTHPAQVACSWGSGCQMQRPDTF